MTSDTDARCGITELLPNECAHCRKLPDPVSIELYTGDMAEATNPWVGKWLPAEYPGNCSTCDEPFKKGTLIRSNGGKGWEAICCE